MRQRLIIILVAVVILVGLGIGAAILVDRSDTVKNAVVKVANLNTNSVVNGNTNASANTNQTLNTNTNPDRAAIIFVAKVFTERFGSYSTADGYAGLLAATSYGTALINETIRKNVVTLKTLPGTRSSVTKALVTNIVNQAATTATVTVQAQRTETIGESRTETTPTLQLQLVKSGADWRVNSASWRI